MYYKPWAQKLTEESWELSPAPLLRAKARSPGAAERRDTQLRGVRGRDGTRGSVSSWAEDKKTKTKRRDSGVRASRRLEFRVALPPPINHSPSPEVARACAWCVRTPAGRRRYKHVRDPPHPLSAFRKRNLGDQSIAASYMDAGPGAPGIGTMSGRQCSFERRFGNGAVES
ncbi:hypothetical protein MTO96_020826 [Rhipicephalus appendiculatus]